MEDYFRLKLFLDYVAPAICLGILGISALIIYVYFLIKDFIQKKKEQRRAKQNDNSNV